MTRGASPSPRASGGGGASLKKLFGRKSHGNNNSNMNNNVAAAEAAAAAAAMVSPSSSGNAGGRSLAQSRNERTSRKNKRWSGLVPSLGGNHSNHKREEQRETSDSKRGSSNSPPLSSPSSPQNTVGSRTTTVVRSPESQQQQQQHSDFVMPPSAIQPVVQPALRGTTAAAAMQQAPSRQSTLDSIPTVESGSVNQNNHHHHGGMMMMMPPAPPAPGTILGAGGGMVVAADGTVPSRGQFPLLLSATGNSRKDLIKWHENIEEQRKRAILKQKQLIKERDGFCRRVDEYDGQVISIGGRPTYELGSYLGGGVAGVVYEGHRLRPMEEYPVRLGINDVPQPPLVDDNNDANGGGAAAAPPSSPPSLINVSQNILNCVPATAEQAIHEGNDITTRTGSGAQQQNNNAGDNVVAGKQRSNNTNMSNNPNNNNNKASFDFEPRNGSILTVDSNNNSILTHEDGGSAVFMRQRRRRTFKEEAALEMTVSNDQLVIIDAPDAPSRSAHYAKAVSMNSAAAIAAAGNSSSNNSVNQNQNNNNNGINMAPSAGGMTAATTILPEDDTDFPSDASITYGLMEETVAIKVLNPVGFRTLNPEVTTGTVVARCGAPLERDVLLGKQPMEERHVWWLVNPNSRNLRTLQRYKADAKGPRRVQVDRGCPEKGLRISLIAAYKDADGTMKELPLTRCIEIWGHVPFGASDAEFKSLMSAIDSINLGQPPPAIPAFIKGVPGRVGTENTASTHSDEVSLESLRVSNPMQSKRTYVSLFIHPSALIRSLFVTFISQISLESLSFFFFVTVESIAQP